MATLMEFAAAILERDGGSRALDGSVPPAVVTPPVLHWGVESMLSWLKLDDGLPRLTTDQDPEYAKAIGLHNPDVT